MDAEAEALIRHRVADCVRAVRAKDIDHVMSFYAPDVVSFDLSPPLRYARAERKREAWLRMFASYAGPIAYDVHELSVTVAGDLACVHSLNHVSGRLAAGRGSDLWLRWTACLRRIAGAWLIVHDHVSVPADLEQGRAAMNLTP